MKNKFLSLIMLLCFACFGAARADVVQIGDDTWSQDKFPIKTDWDTSPCTARYWFVRDAKNHGKFDVHATTFDRETMSYNIAKQLLDSGKIKDPDIIKYLTFIMSSNVGVNQTERILAKSQIKHLAPEFMDDFNKGLSKWLKKNNIPPKEVSVDQLFK